MRKTESEPGEGGREEEERASEERSGHRALLREEDQDEEDDCDEVAKAEGLQLRRTAFGFEQRSVFRHLDRRHEEIDDAVFLPAAFDAPAQSHPHPIQVFYSPLASRRAAEVGVNAESSRQNLLPRYDGEAQQAAPARGFLVEQCGETAMVSALIVGDQNAGKSTFLHAFCRERLGGRFLQLTSFLPFIQASFSNARLAFLSDAQGGRKRATRGSEEASRERGNHEGDETAEDIQREDIETPERDERIEADTRENRSQGEHERCSSSSSSASDSSSPSSSLLLSFCRDERPFLDSDVARSLLLFTLEDFLFFCSEFSIPVYEKEAPGASFSAAPRAPGFLFSAWTRYVALHLLELGGDHLDRLVHFLDILEAKRLRRRDSSFSPSSASLPASSSSSSPRSAAPSPALCDPHCAFRPETPSSSSDSSSSLASSVSPPTVSSQDARARAPAAGECRLRERRGRKRAAAAPAQRDEAVEVAQLLLREERRHCEKLVAEKRSAEPFRVSHARCLARAGGGGGDRAASGRLRDAKEDAKSGAETGEGIPRNHMGWRQGDRDGDPEADERDARELLRVLQRSVQLVGDAEQVVYFVNCQSLFSEHPGNTEDEVLKTEGGEERGQRAAVCGGDEARKRVSRSGETSCAALRSPLSEPLSSSPQVSSPSGLSLLPSSSSASSQSEEFSFPLLSVDALVALLRRLQALASVRSLSGSSSAFLPSSPSSRGQGLLFACNRLPEVRTASNALPRPAPPSLSESAGLFPPSFTAPASSAEFLWFRANFWRAMRAVRGVARPRARDARGVSQREEREEAETDAATDGGKAALNALETDEELYAQFEGVLRGLRRRGCGSSRDGAGLHAESGDAKQRRESSAEDQEEEEEDEEERDWKPFEEDETTGESWVCEKKQEERRLREHPVFRFLAAFFSFLWSSGCSVSLPASSRRLARTAACGAFPSFLSFFELRGVIPLQLISEEKEDASSAPGVPASSLPPFSVACLVRFLVFLLRRVCERGAALELNQSRNASFPSSPSAAPPAVSASPALADVAGDAQDAESRLRSAAPEKPEEAEITHVGEDEKAEAERECGGLGMQQHVGRLVTGEAGRLALLGFLRVAAQLRRGAVAGRRPPIPSSSASPLLHLWISGVDVVEILDGGDAHRDQPHASPPECRARSCRGSLAETDLASGDGEEDGDADFLPATTVSTAFPLVARGLVKLSAASPFSPLSAPFPPVALELRWGGEAQAVAAGNGEGDGALKSERLRSPLRSLVFIPFPRGGCSPLDPRASSLEPSVSQSPLSRLLASGSRSPPFSGLAGLSQGSFAAVRLPFHETFFGFLLAELRGLARAGPLPRGFWERNARAGDRKAKNFKRNETPPLRLRGGKLRRSQAHSEAEGGTDALREGEEEGERGDGGGVNAEEEEGTERRKRTEDQRPNEEKTGQGGTCLGVGPARSGAELKDRNAEPREREEEQEEEVSIGCLNASSLSSDSGAWRGEGADAVRQALEHAVQKQLLRLDSSFSLLFSGKNAEAGAVNDCGTVRGSTGAFAGDRECLSLKKQTTFALERLNSRGEREGAPRAEALWKGRRSEEGEDRKPARDDEKPRERTAASALLETICADAHVLMQLAGDLALLRNEDARKGLSEAAQGDRRGEKRDGGAAPERWGENISLAWSVERWQPSGVVDPVWKKVTMSLSLRRSSGWDRQACEEDAREDGDRELKGLPEFQTLSQRGEEKKAEKVPAQASDHDTPSEVSRAGFRGFDSLWRALGVHMHRRGDGSLRRYRSAPRKDAQTLPAAVRGADDAFPTSDARGATRVEESAERAEERRREADRKGNLEKDTCCEERDDGDPEAGDRSRGRGREEARESAHAALVAEELREKENLWMIRLG
ncbi:hypothetical protein BESB_017530 [Besnoitia besnoiti]|uniref:Uncharacterized protein n=1 Tax=Besnoitia besnoiti TaxID=94643 RepID=A0A2A9M398_BESBE|nr:hypothetical protein BESB_017530 [Besnoitia besnoiti]PFH32435.1 hypothetical protein BESB_017530 [Besnoitia besnoiti]